MGEVIGRRDSGVGIDCGHASSCVLMATVRQLPAPRRTTKVAEIAHRIDQCSPALRPKGVAQGGWSQPEYRARSGSHGCKRAAIMIVEAVKSWMLRSEVNGTRWFTASGSGNAVALTLLLASDLSIQPATPSWWPPAAR
jgi:hypothetical protein